MSKLHQFSTIEGKAVLRQWDDAAARGCREISAVIEALDVLPSKWRNEADFFAQRADEARMSGTVFGGTLAVATALRNCANDLENAMEGK